MAIGMIVGHSSRSFPVHREKVGVGGSGAVVLAGRHFLRASHGTAVVQGSEAETCFTRLFCGLVWRITLLLSTQLSENAS